jgi:hypothetical protein
MEPENNDDFTDLLAEEPDENYETSPCPPSPGSSWEGD